MHASMNSSKRQRQSAAALAALGKESYASQSAIANLLKHVKRHGIPTAFSRPSQYRAKKEICATRTDFGTITQQVSLPLSKGDSKDVTMQAPLPFFAYNCEQSDTYARIVGDAMRAHPCTPASPWHIILYQDGIDPSDMGATHHTRSACAWYWSIAEFGMYALSHEEVWGCICTLRKSEYNQVQGGMCGVLAAVLKLFRGIHDIKLAGIRVHVKGQQPLHMFADVNVYFGDEPAIKEMIDCKGHAGHKPCCLCSNVCLVSSMELYKFKKPMVTIACTDWNEIKKGLHTDETIKASCARLQNLNSEREAGRITKQEFEDRSGLIGWNFNPVHPELFNRLNLQVASSVMWDWPHVYVHGGLADLEFGHFMKLAQKRSINITSIL